MKWWGSWSEGKKCIRRRAEKIWWSSGGFCWKELFDLNWTKVQRLFHRNRLISRQYMVWKWPGFVMTRFQNKGETLDTLLMKKTEDFNTTFTFLTFSNENDKMIKEISLISFFLIFLWHLFYFWLRVLDLLGWPLHRLGFFEKVSVWWTNSCWAVEEQEENDTVTSDINPTGEKTQPLWSLSFTQTVKAHLKIKKNP